MKKRAICVGINNYPGTANDLYGCINDAQDWAALLKNEFGFGQNVSIITDQDATKNNLLTALNYLVTQAGDGDMAVFTFSGHGTAVPDSGDFDEADNLDEAICAYDGDIIDDEIRSIVRKIHRKAQLVIVCDSCHSGTVTRMALRKAREPFGGAADYALRARYMPPRSEIGALKIGALPVRQRFSYPETDMPELLLTGCNAHESAWDASINGRYNGVMSAFAIRLIKQNPKLTWRELHQKLRQEVDRAGFGQSPQLEGADQHKNLPVFSVAETAPGQTNSLQAVIITESLNIRSGPSVEYSKIGVLKNGEVVPVINMDGKDMWLEIAPGKWIAMSYNNKQYARLKFG